MTTLNVGLVGAGQMGASHARVISESPLAHLAVIVDIDGAASERLAAKSGALASTDLLAVASCDAVVVASSTTARMDTVLPLLELGIPLLVEKPFAPSVAELEDLLSLAARRGIPVMCGFVERFNAAFQTALQVLEQPPRHLLAIRHSPPAPRIASTVVNDLMLHDLDAAQRLFGALVPRLTGAACLRPASSDFNEIADCTIMFGEVGVATLSANRMGQRKVRTLMIHSDTQLIEVDLLRQDVSVYRNMSQDMMPSGGGMGYRSSTEIELPFVRHAGEPLSLQFAHFMALCDGRADAVEELRQIWPAHLLAEQIELTSG